MPISKNNLKIVEEFDKSCEQLHDPQSEGTYKALAESYNKARKALIDLITQLQNKGKKP